ncbi:BON domain-containing protein [Variovorax sp. H27-G14]|uniref:BON domain-containing protein n=1 Tax=Variovorax sp. H27-G14 TaxID=3111914 RepID=UPI0038FC9836
MTKTDSQIQYDVLAELAWEPSVDAASIGVEVHDGIVTLAGHVQRASTPSGRPSMRPSA